MSSFVGIKKTILKFPLKVGHDKDVEKYSSSLVNGEEQLLVTRECNMYITDGHGGYKTISTKKEKEILDKIEEINNSIETLKKCDENIEKDYKERILTIESKIGNMDDIDSFFSEKDNIIDCLNLLKKEIDELPIGFGGQAPSISDLNKFKSLKSFSKHSSIPDIEELFELDDDLNIPILFGKECDIDCYASLITNGEKQLLVTEDTGKIVLTDGCGGYKAVFNGKVTAANVDIKLNFIDETMTIEEAFNKFLNNELKVKELNIADECFVDDFIVG